jgi:23S rRNA (cytidine1920-2'-O)/16S rRNA (cytidine1409-2'-O)-methyltransferase
MKSETLRLDQALVLQGLCNTRSEAQELIEKGLVEVNGIVSTKKIKKITSADILTLTGKRKYVSRGGEKLEGALYEIFKLEEGIRRALSRAVCLDIGSSTGGFTDCLLQHGVAHVDAVDVGTDQLHPSLKSNLQVSSYEKTDIRFFVHPKKYDVIVADLSFISALVIMDTLQHYAKKGTHIFLLIKPQFEVGKGNTKKGIVKDEQLAKEAVITVLNQVKELGVEELVTFPCVIKGGDGNQEYFLYARKN